MCRDGVLQGPEGYGEGSGKVTVAKWAGIIVAVLINGVFLVLEVKGLPYSDLFVSALTASWGFLGLTANSVRSERKQRADIKAEQGNA